MQHTERPRVILRHIRVLRIAAQLIVAQHRRAPHDHNIVALASLAHLYRPSRTALRVSRRQVSDQHRPAQPHLVPIVQYTVDLSLGILLETPVHKVRLASALDHTRIVRHHLILRMGRPQDGRAPRRMVEMSMADQQHLHIRRLELKCPDVLQNLRRGARQIAVDQDVPFRRYYQIRGQILAPNVIQVPRDPKRRMVRRPRRVRLRAHI